MLRGTPKWDLILSIDLSIDPSDSIFLSIYRSIYLLAACFTWSSAWILIVDFRVDFVGSFFVFGHAHEVSESVMKSVFLLWTTLGTGKRGHYERGLFAGGISRISKISKFSRISRKWSDSSLFSTVWGFSKISRISKFSRISRKWTFLKRPLFQKTPFSEPETHDKKSAIESVAKSIPLCRKNHRSKGHSHQKHLPQFHSAETCALTIYQITLETFSALIY